MADVSFIIPAYNAGPWIEECLASVDGQVALPVGVSTEIIVINDGSTDDTETIVTRYSKKSPGIKLVNQPNAGLSAARNRGIDLATGRYIVFVDADDVLHPMMLSLMLAVAGEMPENSVVISPMRHGAVPTTFPTVSKPRYKRMPGIKAVEHGLYRRVYETTMCGVLIPAALLDSKTRFRPGWYEDLDMFYRVYERAAMVAVVSGHPLYYYRDNNQSFINSVSHARFDVLDVVDRLRDHYRDTPLQAAAEDRVVSASFNILRLIWTNRVDAPQVEARCLDNIARLRRGVLLNPRGRFINKPVLLGSYLGRQALKRILSC